MSQARQHAEQKQAEAGGPRIAIVGAGPAGLAAAWFLKQRGYRNVTIFERHGRVGGLCFTLNDGYRAYDLGGNYITPAYRETRKIARAVGATTYRSHPYIGLRLTGKPGAEELSYVDMTDVVREIRDAKGNPTEVVSWTTMALAGMRYVIARWKVRKVIDRPDFGEVHKHKELCVPFDEWLETNGLGVLRSLFEIPITMMGYGFLHEIAAPYALKYMPLRTFIPMCLRQVWWIGWMFPWPRRFTLGFQRMWEAVSWQLNVRTDVNITGIWRYGDVEPPEDVPTEAHPIRIDLNYPAHIFGRDPGECFTRWFDHLIVASARAGDELPIHLKPDSPERRLSDKVKTFGFCMTTFHAEPAGAETDKPFLLKRHVVCVLPFRTERTNARPWVVVQLWPEDSEMLQCYTRLPEPDEKAEVEANRRIEVLEGAERMVKLLGGNRAGSRDPRGCRWEHYEQWPYFGHVQAKDFEEGFYHDLETKVQGRANTYWVGGFTNFELIEPIVCYAKAIVEKNFPPLPGRRGA